MTGNGFYSYNNQLDAFTLYHLVQEDAVHGEAHTRPDAGPVLPALGHALAGAIAAALAKASVYPIETIVTRMQVQQQLKGRRETPSAASDVNAEYTSLLDAARKIYKHEGGLGGFYPGLGADVSKSVVDTFLFFLAYNSLRSYQAKRDGVKHLTVLKELGVGIVAGCLAKAVTTPIQNIVTRQQTAALVAARDPTSSTTPEQSDKLSVKDIALQIRSEKGIAGFWSGYSASMILTLNPAITFAGDNALRRLLPRSERENPSARMTFLLAAFSKVLATTLTYPVMLAKSRAQASSASPTRNVPDEKVPETLPKPDSDTPRTQARVQTNSRKAYKLFAGNAVLTSLLAIYRREGIAGLYAGLEGELLKAFLQHGLTMTVKESVHGGVIQMYFALLKLTDRWPANLQQAQDGVKSLGQGAGDVARDAGERVGNVSATMYEGAKSLGQGAGERISNVGTNAWEGAKSLGVGPGLTASDVAAKAGNSSSSVVGGARDVTADIGERATNIGVTVAEGAKSLGKKAVGSDE